MKVVQMTKVHKEVQEVASTTVLMPTKTRSGAIGKTPQRTTTSELSVKKKKLRKMMLPSIDDEKKNMMDKLCLRGHRL